MNKLLFWTIAMFLFSIQIVTAGQPDNTSGLILYYQFNNDTARGENDSLILDHSVRLNTERAGEVHHNASVNSGVLVKSIYNTTKKLLGSKDICFAGDADDELLIPDGEYHTFTDDFTFCYWINPVVGTGDRTFLTTGTDWDGANDVTSYVASIDVIVFDGRAGSTKPLSLIGTATIGTGSWKFVCGRRNATHGTLFINAVEDATDTTPAGTLGNNADNLMLGDDPAGAFDGCVAEVQIWNRSLEKREIVSLYNGGLGEEITPPDTTKPIVKTTFNISVNNIKINDIINFTGNITDETGLSTANITINFTSGKLKFNFTGLSGTSAQISNKTKITDTQGNVINFTMYVTDTSNNVNQNSTLITIADTSGSIFIGINNTSPKKNEVINVSGNATDIDGDFSQGIASYNVSGKPQRNFSFDIAGTKGNFSQAITINLTRGNVINFTVFYNDTAGTTFQNSTLITVDDTPISFGSFINTSDLTYNRNKTINWSCSDADSPPDTITSNAYFDTIDPPKVQIASNVDDYNITTNMTTDGKYFLNATCESNGVTAYSTIFNISLDVSTPTMSGFPANGTFYRSSTNISLTLNDNIQLFEGNCSLYSLSGVLLNSTNKTNISSTSYLFNFSLNVSEIGDGQNNLSCWTGDTKNKNKEMPSSVKSGKDKTDKTKTRSNVYVFNDTATGLQINISVLTNSTKLGHPKDNQNLEINLTLIDDDYFKLTIAYDADEDNQVTFLNFTSNQKITRIHDQFATHLLFGNGKNRLSYDSDDAVEEFNMEVIEGTESYVISYIPKNSIAKGDRLTIDPRQDNNNVLENSAIIEFDTENPQFFSLNVSKDGTRLNNSFFNADSLNFSSNVSDKNNDSLTYYINNIKNITIGYRSNQSMNTTINFSIDGNYSVLIEINDSAGNKINSTFLNVVIDTTSPTFIEAVNRTIANSTNILPTTDVNLSVFGFVDIYADTGNFSENCSSSSNIWINHTSFNRGNGTYHLIIESANLTSNEVCGWKFYAYDLAGNELDPIYTFIVGTLTTASSTTGGGGGSSGGSFNLDQLECNQRAKQQNRCLTYNPDSKSCESGCQSNYACNEDFVCEGTFLQPDYIPLANLLVPNLQEEQCFKQGYSFFQDSCYNCNGKLANLKGTIVCLQCKQGFKLNDNNVCIQTLLQRTQTTLNPIDKLARKISPNNPFLGFLIMVGVGGMLIYAYSNRTIIKTKFRRY